MHLINKLRERLQEPLPGIAAQLKMMSSKMKNGDSSIYFRAAEDAKKACVMLLLFQKGTTWYTALMQRPESEYPHSKQISFPGGGLEEQDADLEAGAIRETQEEFGIPGKEIETIGQLSKLYIPISGYLVHPFVGYLKKAPKYIPDEKEVSEIIEVKLEDLLNPDLRKKTNINTFGGYILRDTPYFDLNDKVVWGATAMMLSEFVEVMETLDSNL
jgi:8-oxo-dGTP pyrophosphatase MutT (NUDIX family)